ncbi:MAG: DUF928 domain-containing protein [Phormidesmis sp.]
MNFLTDSRYPNQYLSRLLMRCAIFTTTLIGTSLVGLDLTLPASTASATATAITTPKAYIPPPEPTTPRGPFIPAGRRTGCQGALHNGLTAIAPQQQVGQTISTQPTLTWYIASTTLTTFSFSYTNIQTTNGSPSQK